MARRRCRGAKLVPLSTNDMVGKTRTRRGRTSPTAPPPKQPISAGRHSSLHHSARARRGPKPGAVGWGGAGRRPWSAPPRVLGGKWNPEARRKRDRTGADVAESPSPSCCSSSKPGSSAAAAGPSSTFPTYFLFPSFPFTIALCSGMLLLPLNSNSLLGTGALYLNHPLLSFALSPRPPIS